MAALQGAQIQQEDMNRQQALAGFGSAAQQGLATKLRTEAQTTAMEQIQAMMQSDLTEDQREKLMPTNAQLISGDYFLSSAAIISDMMSQTTEEWDTLRANEVAYNDMLVNQISVLDNTIRQYGSIRDTQAHRLMQDNWQLVRYEQGQDRRAFEAERSTMATVGNLLADVRTDAGKAMAGEGADTMDFARVLSGDASAEDMEALIVAEINNNPTMGRFLAENSIAGAGGGGNASPQIRLAGGVGVYDTLRRVNASNGGTIGDDRLRSMAAAVVGLPDGTFINEAELSSSQTIMTPQ